ncbi:MAG TPA: hypothetical protein VIV60_20725 [Polyangiaceae bacterium]
MEVLKAQMLELAAKGKFEQAIDSVISTMLTMERASDCLAWRVLKAMRRLHQELGRDRNSRLV